MEIIPIGIVINWGGYYQPYTFHSYFDLDVWNNGDMGPFLCGIFTIIVFCMTLLTLVFKLHRSYLLANAALTLTTVILSLIPTFFDEYSVFGVIISVLLSVATELNILVFLDKKK